MGTYFVRSALREVRLSGKDSACRIYLASELCLDFGKIGHRERDDGGIDTRCVPWPSGRFQIHTMDARLDRIFGLSVLELERHTKAAAKTAQGT